MSYDVDLERWDGSVWVSVDSVTSVTDTFYDWTGLDPDTDYRWRVRAVDGADASDWSAWETVTTLSSSVTVDLGAVEQDQDVCSLTAASAVDVSVGAQETGQDTASLTASPTVSASLGAQETGQDTCSLTASVEADTVSVTLAAQETGQDAVSLTVSPTVEASIAAQEIGQDTASLTVSVESDIISVTLGAVEQGQDAAALTAQTGAVKVEVAAQEAGQDTASLTASSIVEADIAAQETGQDVCSLTASAVENIASVTLGAVEEGQDTAALTADPIAGVSLGAQEQGNDEAGLFAQSSVEALLAAQEQGQDAASLTATVDSDAGEFVFGVPWGYNTAPFAGGPGGVRVAFAAAILGAAAMGSGAAAADRAGAADAIAGASASPEAMVYRSGAVEGPCTALSEVGWPYDLAWATGDSEASAEAEPTRISNGSAEFESSAAGLVNSIRYAFFADLVAGAEFDAGATKIVAGGAVFDGIALLEPAFERWLGAEVDALCEATGEAEEFVYRAGVHTLDAGATADVYALINGVHETEAVLYAGADGSVDALRSAGGFADIQATASFSVQPYPWLGSEVEGIATASAFATWWAYIDTRAEGGGLAEVEAAAHRVRGLSLVAEGSATAEAIWSRWVEPRVIFSQGSAFSSVEPWRIRHEAMSYSAGATMQAEALRISFQDVGFEGSATSEVQAFVNFTNDAPDWRSMTVPYEDRTMVVPFEDRTMVVR